MFTRTKHGANRLAEQLGRDGIAAAAIHGNKSQGQRVRALDDFKAGRAAILVATEVAVARARHRGAAARRQLRAADGPRGLRPPDRPHRPGRRDRRRDLARLRRRGAAPPRHRAAARPSDPDARSIPGFEPDRSIRPEPIRQRSGERRPSPPRPAVPRRQPGHRPGRPVHVPNGQRPGRPVPYAAIGHATGTPGRPRSTPACRPRSAAARGQGRAASTEPGAR